ncbi:dabb domain containing protein [Rhypophila decipiens]
MSTPITHIVLLGIKSDTKPDDVKTVSFHSPVLRHVLGADAKTITGNYSVFGTQGRLSATQQPYITSIKGGEDNSIEGLHGDVTHAFVVEFASAEDRLYYVHRDPAHKAFIQFVGGLINKLIVVDFAS